jgi:hypothetical protein
VARIDTTILLRGKVVNNEINKQNDRVVAYGLARELTAEEILAVSGGATGTSICGSGVCTYDKDAMN